MTCAGILGSWRRWIRFAVIFIYITLLVIAVPLCIWELERKGAPNHVQAWFVGGIFVLMALPISFWGILQHIINYSTPHLQRHIIRILWMVPIYALNAWFALRFPDAAIYLDTLRECYEAYVIYNFMGYLLSFLHHEYPDLDMQIEDKPPVKHIFPLCLLPPCKFSQKFIQRCRHGVLQYTVVRPAMTVIALITEIFGKYEEGDFNFSTSWSYIVVINNLSQIMAMYCLVLFYKAFKEELKPLKPVPKFVCVKAVVFLSFWQALIIAALTKMDVIPSNGSWVFYKDIKQVATGLQDFVICIEMFLAAIGHYLSFSHKPFINLAAEQQDCCTSFMSMWNVRDVTDDVVEHARYIGHGVKKTLIRGKNAVIDRKTEKTPLLSNTDSQSTRYDAAIPMSVQNSQTKEPPSPAVVVENSPDSNGNDIINNHNSSVNKFLMGASNLTSDDLNSNSASQDADGHIQSTSNTYENNTDENDVDESDGKIQKKNKKYSKIIVVAEVNFDIKDDTKNDIFEELNLDDPDQIPSHSTNVVQGDDSQNDSIEVSTKSISDLSQHFQIESSGQIESTDDAQSGCGNIPQSKDDSTDEGTITSEQQVI